MTFVFTSSNGQVLLGWETVVSFIRAPLNQPVSVAGAGKRHHSLSSTRDLAIQDAVKSSAL